MEIPVYLALSAAEFYTCETLPPKAAYMACRFSPGGNGLSNIPDFLPKDSLLILDDSNPYQNHDFDLILSQLENAVSGLKPVALLLDFQRHGIEPVQRLVNIITAALPCPVVVSSFYAEALDCPVFLPPGPLYKPLTDFLRPYKNRQIWLDAAPVCAQMVITPKTAQYISQMPEFCDPHGHYDPSLHCHYHIKIEQEQIVFTFSRGCDSLAAWLQEAETLGVCGAVGLYHELNGFIC